MPLPEAKPAAGGSPDNVHLLSASLAPASGVAGTDSANLPSACAAPASGSADQAVHGGCGKSGDLLEWTAPDEGEASCSSSDLAASSEESLGTASAEEQVEEEEEEATDRDSSQSHASSELDLDVDDPEGYFEGPQTPPRNMGSESSPHQFQSVQKFVRRESTQTVFGPAATRWSLSRRLQHHGLGDEPDPRDETW